MTRTRDVATQGGLVLLNTTAFSAQSTVSVNSLFNAAYDNYKIVISYTAGSTSLEVFLRLRASGSDTSANYNSVRIFSVNGGNPLGGLSPTGNDEFFIGQFASASPTRSVSNIELFNPQKAQATAAVAQFSYFDGTNLVGNYLSGYQSDTTQFDGVSIITSTGTMTGTISIYGMRK